jgi:putative spermidine/putrescine transport system ATP-binding protein
VTTAPAGSGMLGPGAEPAATDSATAGAAASGRDTPVTGTSVTGTSVTGQEGTAPLSLELRSVGKALGGRNVVHGLDLEVPPGELLCILGPSGCGKTTTLRMIAGFIQPDSGRVFIDGKDMTEVGAQHRPTAMVFQNYALWPHMTVLRNITFGLRARGMSKVAANERAHEALRLVGLGPHASRLPGGLSGGEQQRVALARAMVLEPTVLLMDEPLSNLDAQLRLRVREELVELQQRTGVTMIFVTHDQDEALSIAHRVAVMNEGRLDQVDAPATVYRDPATAFVAGFVGRLNVMAGSVQGARLKLTWATNAISLMTASAPAVPGPNGSTIGLVDGPVEVAVRPEEVFLTDVTCAGTGQVLLDGTVVRTLSRGHFDEVLVTTPLGTLRAYIAAGTRHGGDVCVCFGRMLLYQSNRLVGTANGSQPGCLPEGPPGQEDTFIR